MNATRRSINVSVEPASAEHVPEIAALAAVVWRAHYPGIISHEQINYMLTRMYDLEMLGEEMNSGMTFERALVDGTLHGFSSFGPADGGDEFKLHKLYVHPEWQRCGIGAALLKSFEHAARANGAHTLVLNVNKRNDTAINAYRKNGFAIRESFIVDIGGGFVMDDYVMTMRLEPPT